MDIGIDQGAFHNDLIKTKDGKYIYKIDDNRFEIKRFNRDFEQYKERRKEQMRRKLDEKLAILNRPIEPIPIYNQTIGEIAIGAKDAFMGILDDILNFNLSFKILTKQGRLFYIGLISLSILVFVYLLDLLYQSSTANNNKKN